MEQIKVLLVDDEVDFINMMQYWLNNQGFDVDVLYDGEKVIDCVRERGYQIMFLDLKLPRVEGMEILRQLREFNRDLPVIIFSAYGTKEKIKEAAALGVSGFFSKDRDFEEAARMIHTALRLHKGLPRQQEGEN